MDDVLTLSRPPMQARRPELIPAAVVGVVLAILFGLALFTLRTPDTVRLTVDNTLPWRAEVSVRAAGSTSWTGAGAVSRGGRLDFLELPDQGADWVLRFSYAGQSEEIEITRDELAAQDWTVQVPEGLAGQLRAAGIPDSTDNPVGGSGGS